MDRRFGNEEQEKAKLRRWAMCGQIFEHYKGGRYIVECVAVNEADGELIVLYRTEDFSRWWTRPLRDWESRIDGRPRFLRVES